MQQVLFESYAMCPSLKTFFCFFNQVTSASGLQHEAILILTYGFDIPTGAFKAVLVLQ